MDRSSGVRFPLIGYELLSESSECDHSRPKSMSLRIRREKNPEQSGGARVRPGDYGPQLKDCWTRMKVHIADGVSTGDNFLHPLGEIREVLESIILGNDNGPPLSPNFLNELRNLYYFITEKLISYMSRIHSFKREMGELLIDVLCYISAVDYDNMATFPEVFASCLLYFLPSSSWERAADEVLNRLCRYVLPKCLADCHDLPYTCMSASSSLMMVLGSCQEKKHHLLISDTLMQLKRDVCTDILSLIAFGTPIIRDNALSLLLHYWPIPIPEFSQDSHFIYGEWNTPSCENANCRKGNSRVTMVCLDRQCAAQHKATSIKLYMLLCPDCDLRIHGSSPESDHLRMPIPRPLREVKPNCEYQQTCSSRGQQVNRAEVTCYDSSCSVQNGLPVRMCRDCHAKKHKDVTDSRHFFQVGPPDPWVSDDLGSCSMMLEAVSKLIEVVPKAVPRDSPPLRHGHSHSHAHGHMGTLPRPSVPHHVSFAARSQIDIGVSREGMWLLSNYCTPTTTVRASQQEWLVHLVALVLEWLQSYYTILHQAREEETSNSAPDSSLDATDSEPAYLDYSAIFSNYGDISDNLISAHTLRWFCAVCDSNLECVVEALKPDLPGCAQVGYLWNKAYDANLRYQRTLSVLHQLFLLCHGGKLPEESVMKIFPLVVPDWLDLLVKLRAEPGKMEKLQEQFKGIFSYKTHEEGLKTFSFIWDRFRDNNPDKMQVALYWLQDLTRLEVAIPYLPHMCEDALRERRGKLKRTAQTESTTSFDQGAKIKLEEMDEKDSNERKRDSVGSMSGYDSETALVSQSSLEQGETHVIVSVNSSLTRFILILDIWFTQLTQLRTLADQYSQLQKTLLRMLQTTWGSNHSIPDHLETSNGCLLCHGMSLWLTLANKLILKYVQIELEKQDADEEEAPDFSAAASRASRFSIKTVMKTSGPKKKFASTIEQPPSTSRPSSARDKKYSQDSPVGHAHHLSLSRRHSDERSDSFHSSYSSEGAGGRGAEQMRAAQRRRSPKPRPRRIGMQRYPADFEVVGSGGQDVMSPEEVVSPGQRQRAEIGSTPSLYAIFQNILQQKVTTKLHPDTVLHMVNLLTTLIHSCHVLDWADSKDQALHDILELFNKLWDCLAIENSNVACICVGLLMECVHFLAHNPLPSTAAKQSPRPQHAHSVSAPVTASSTPTTVEEGEGLGGMVMGRVPGLENVEDGVLWKTLHKGLTAQQWMTKFKTVERFTVLLQFMCSSEVVDIPFSEFQDSVKAAVGYGFCLLTQLLQDKNSNVCARAKFCISNISDISLRAVKEFLKVLFLDHIKYRDLVLQSLSLVDASLPELRLMSVDLLTVFLRNVGSSPPAPEGERSMSTSIVSPVSASGAAHLQFTVEGAMHHPAVSKKVSATSVGSGVGAHYGATPKVSITSSLVGGGGAGAAVFSGLHNRELDPEANSLMQKLLSLLLRHIANPRANVKEMMMKEQGPRLHKRPSTLPHRTLARFYTNQNDVMDGLVSAVKEIFNDLDCSPQDLRQSAIFGVFLNHIFPAMDRNIDFGRTRGLLQFVLRMLGLCAAPNERDFPYLHEKSSSKWRECSYNLGHLPPSLRAPWLRVFFVILYKYIQEYSEIDQNWIFLLCRWCMEMTLKTIQAEPHQCVHLTLGCPSVMADGGKSRRPALKRQAFVESLGGGASGSAPATPTSEIPTVNIVDGNSTTMSKLQPPSSRELLSLSPVPEALEGESEEETLRDKENNPTTTSSKTVTATTTTAINRQLSPSTPSPSTTQPPMVAAASIGGGSGHRIVRPINSSTSTLGSQQSSTTELNRKAYTPGTCVSCGKPNDEYSEEVIALSLVAVGTCCHRMPHTASSYLISNIIPAIAKVVLPNSYPWQTYVDKLDQPPPGSAMAVAQHVLASILTQFADRRLFLYLFGHDHGKNAKPMFTAIVNSLADMEGEAPSDQGGDKNSPSEDKLYKWSPIKYFLEDAQSLSNFQSGIKKHSLVNLAVYVEVLQGHLTAGNLQICPLLLTRDIVLWDNFLKKLRTHSDVLRDSKAMQSLLQIFVLFLQNIVDNPAHSFENYHAHKIQAFMQSLMGVVESSLHNVYCPLGGLVMLAALWNKAFQQVSQRESERFVKLYISELRKALKFRAGPGEHARADNFLGLIQVLLLEEDGYLGYVDGLTLKRLYAPDLKREFETHALYIRAIDDLKWDFSEALQFLSCHNLSWPKEMIPQLKLSLAQLVALRVQHTRTPQDLLKRLVAGDIRASAAANVRQGGGNTVLLRWQDHISTLHLFAWLMLGAMCHNAIDVVAVEMRMEGSVSGRCQLFGSLSTHQDEVIKGIIRLLLGALENVATDREVIAFGQLNLMIMFTSIWTVYMELYVAEYAYYVVELWQEFVTRLIKLLLNRNLEENFRREVVHSLNDNVLVKIKQMGLSCYTMLIPIWSEVSKALLSDITFPDFSFASLPLSVDTWFKEAVQELILIESEWPVNAQ